MVIRQVKDRFPEITQRASAQIRDHVDQLVDIKLLAVGHMRRHPEFGSDGPARTVDAIIFGTGCQQRG